MRKLSHWQSVFGCFSTQKTNCRPFKPLDSHWQRIIILVLVLSLFMPLAGCYDAREIDDLAYVMAIGLDKGDSGFIKMTLQIAIPKNISGGGEKGGGGGGEASLPTTIETHSLPVGLNVINTYLSRQLSLSDAKAIVFSEELAKEGIGQYLHSIARNREFRPNMYVVVSKTSAEDYIKGVVPKLEANPSKYYELNLTSYKYNGITPGTTMHNFYFDSESLSIQPVAILASINKFAPDKEMNLQASTYKEKNKPYPFMQDFTAGNIPRKSEFGPEIMGSAVFSSDKMVGELDGEETAYYLMLIGRYNYANWSFTDPKHLNSFISLNIKQNRKPSIKVKLADGKPIIDINLDLEADILSIQSGENYELPGRIGEVESYVSGVIKKDLMLTLNKCTKQFKTDIFGFGKKAKYLVWTWDQWEKMNWHSIFPYSKFNPEISLKIRRPGLIIRTVVPNSSQKSGNASQ